MQVWNVRHTACWKCKTKKNRHLRAIAPVCRAISSQLTPISTIGKPIKQRYLLQTSPQYGELWPTNGWDRFGSLGNPSKFQRVSRLGFFTAATSLIGGWPNLARRLTVSWAGTYIILPPDGILPEFDGILPDAKFTLHPSLAFSYIGSLTTRHSSSGRQPKFAACYKEWNYRTFAECTCTYMRLGGHHGRRSTDVNQTLHDVWPSPGLIHCIYIFGGSYP